MAEVNLSIHGKSYGIACDDGQEGRVNELGQYVDTRLRDIAAAGAASNESHMLVLAALVLADEIYDLKASNQNAQGEAPQQVVHQGLPEQEERLILDAISNLSDRVDKATQRLAQMD
jgi:cell division protein ZapA